MMSGACCLPRRGAHELGCRLRLVDAVVGVTLAHRETRGAQHRGFVLDSLLALVSVTSFNREVAAESNR